MSVTESILKVQNVQGVISSIKDRGSEAKLVNQEYEQQMSWYNWNPSGKSANDLPTLFSYTSGKPFSSIPLDVVVRYTPEVSSTVTTNPTQIGINVNDHVYSNPDTVTVTFGISDIRGTLARLTGIIKSFTSIDSLKNPQTPSQSLLSLLYKAKEEHTLLSLDDGLHVYTNMVITNVTYDKDKTTYRSLVATATLQQFIFVDTNTGVLGSSRPNVVSGKASKYAAEWDRITTITKLV